MKNQLLTMYKHLLFEARTYRELGGNRHKALKSLIKAGKLRRLLRYE